jgi:hypothetical protein
MSPCNCNCFGAQTCGDLEARISELEAAKEGLEGKLEKAYNLIFQLGNCNVCGECRKDAEKFCIEHQKYQETLSHLSKERSDEKGEGK